MKTNHFDPLVHFYSSYKYDLSLINKIVAGEKYTAVLLTNGNIGICANLDFAYKSSPEIPEAIDLSSASHRIIYTAYINALVNYDNTYEDKLDIFAAQNFSGYKQITMIGYFIPLVKKFDDAGIALNVFDKVIEDERLLPEDEKEEYVKSCDCLIISGTTLQNGTFSHLLSLTPTECDIFLLGPSSIMHMDMLTKTNIKAIFGAVFEKNDERVLQLIKEGHGTRDFIKFGNKVVFKK